MTKPTPASQSPQPPHAHEESHGSLKSYTIGFVLSIILTIIPLVLVVKGILTGNALITAIVLMACAQFWVQLYYFMHIKDGEKPRYNVMALILGVVIVFTIVAASIWIMSFNHQVQ